MFHNKKNHGSSLLEYAVLISVIVAALVTASYYVPRAWNAYVQGESDAIKDSYQDPFIKSDSNIVLPGCNCGDWTPTVCNSWTCGPTEMNYHITCDPLGCNVDIGILTIDKCESDASCCGPWNPTGLCGVSGGCPDGQMQHTAPCGGGAPNIFTCEPDNDCIFECGSGAPPGPYGVVCPGDDVGLPSDIPWSYVNHDGCSSPDGSPPKCEYACQPPFIGDLTVGCTCPEGFANINDTCVFQPTKTETASSVGCENSSVSCGNDYTAVGGGFEIPQGTPVQCDGSHNAIVWASSYPSNDTSWIVGVDDYYSPLRAVCLRNNAQVIGDTQIITTSTTTPWTFLYPTCPNGTYLLGGGIDIVPNGGDAGWMTSMPEWENNRWKCQTNKSTYSCSALCGVLTENTGTPKNITYVTSTTANCSQQSVTVGCPPGTALIGGGNKHVGWCPGSGGVQWWSSLPIDQGPQKGFFCRAETQLVECTAICIDI